MYIVCGINDENYTEAMYEFFYTYASAKNKAIIDCVNQFDGNGEIETMDNGFRITSKYEEAFYVTEIKQIDQSQGNYLLVWHHGYEGVNFEIKYQGTYDECVLQRKREIKELTNSLQLLDEDINDNVVDTGNEWEVWDIVKIA